jgi:hypothetical protein
MMSWMKIYLSHKLDERHANDATGREEVHNYLSAKLQYEVNVIITIVNNVTNIRLLLF